MALKLFCKRCHKFIKEVSPAEASGLNGNEVCVECEETARSYIKQLDMLYKKLSGELDTKHNAAIVKLEEVIHNAFE